MLAETGRWISPVALAIPVPRHCSGPRQRTGADNWGSGGGRKHGPGGETDIVLQDFFRYRHGKLQTAEGWTILPPDHRHERRGSLSDIFTAQVGHGYAAN